MFESFDALNAAFWKCTVNGMSSVVLRWDTPYVLNSTDATYTEVILVSRLDAIPCVMSKSLSQTRKRPSAMTL